MAAGLKKQLCPEHPCIHERCKKAEGKSVNEQELLQEIMIVLLLTGSYLGILSSISRRSAVRQMVPAAAGVLLAFFVILAVTLLYVSRLLGADVVLLAVLLLIAFVTFSGAVHYLSGHFRDMNHGAAAVLLVYLIVVGCITVFSRDGSGDHTTSLLRMDLLETMLRTHSVIPIRHILQNVALFIPLGVLLPYTDEYYLDYYIYPFFVSLALSVLIESTQLFLNLGQADLTDIAANVLGGMLGYLMYHILRRMGLSEKEDDD